MYIGKADQLHNERVCRWTRVGQFSREHSVLGVVRQGRPKVGRVRTTYLYLRMNRLKSTLIRGTHWIKACIKASYWYNIASLICIHLQNVHLGVTRIRTYSFLRRYQVLNFLRHEVIRAHMSIGYHSYIVDLLHKSGRGCDKKQLVCWYDEDF